MELFPDGQGLSLSLNYLLDENLLHLVDQVVIDWFLFVICDVVDGYSCAVDKFLTAWDAGPTPALAAVIGDWEMVHQLASTTGQRRLTERAERQSGLTHRGWQVLLQFEAGGVLRDEVLYALAHAEVEDLSEWLTDALANPHVAGTAAKIIGGDPVWQKR
ncbi:MAG: hypothetical protein KDA84_07820, partial [Planctomycetaceae bacterium]|nr:hypothetical protein [Planctomycetaceae bacterium]